MMAYYGENAKVLSGGMSLIPLMKLRFAAPDTIVDLNQIEGLDYIEEAGGYLRIGCLARNRAIVRSAIVRSRHPLMASAAPTISDPVVRNRGTLVGNCCHADPQGDWATVMMCLDGEIVARSVDGERVIPITQFVTGPFTNTLQPNEIAVEARIPGGTSFGQYHKIERKVGDFATVAVAVHVHLDGDRIETAGIGLTAVGPTNIKAAEAERALHGQEPTDKVIADAARLAAEAAAPKDDVRGSAAYKKDVVRVFVQRGLKTAVARAKEGRK